LNLLLLCPATLEETGRALGVLASGLGPADRLVLLAREGIEVPATPAAVEILRRPARAPGLAVLRLRRELAARGFERIVVPLRGAPHAPAPVARILFFGSLPGAEVFLLAEGSPPARLRPAFLVREALRSVAFHVLDAAARIVARLLVAAFSPPSPAGIRPSRRERRGGSTFVLPVLPDLSHTFLYREVLAILERSPAEDVVTLRRGEATTVHPEAGALLPRVRFAPRDGVVRRHLRVARRMLRSPARTADLLALYARRPGGRAGDLLGRGPLEEADHPGNAFGLADLLERRGGGRIHVYGSTYPANVAMGAAILLGLPFSVSAFEDFDFPYRFKLLEEKHRLARFFRVTTRASRERLASLLGVGEDARIHVVPWGMDPAGWGPVGPHPEGDVLFTACRLVEKKGLRHLVPALARLRDRGIPARWAVAGDGPERAALETLVREGGLEERVEFLGALPSDRVRALLQRARIAVLPCVVARNGDRDGIPTFVLEAMLCGVPVVTTPISGIPELVVEGETGFLAPPEDPEGLAATLERVWRDPARARAVAARGRDRAVRTQDVRESARRLLDLLVSISPDGSGPGPEGVRAAG
jgi:glycosyltransferase involved in cell wall biosynthesis